MLVTRDGAQHWRRSLSVRSGFWGVDVLDVSRAWAVGVTGLYRTANGGASWQRVGEPTEPLVRVAFASPRKGFGLTVKRLLVETDDSGASWQQTRWAGRGVALCAASSRVVLVADPTGGIWRSGNDGIRWRRVAAGYAPVESYWGWATDLSCHGANVIEFSQAFCQAACAGGVATRVRQSTDRGLTWRTNAYQGVGAGNVRTQPVSAASLPLDHAAALGSGGICLVGYTFDQPARIGITCATEPAASYHQAIVPRLPFPGRDTTIVVQGIDFFNARTGWMLLDEYTASAEPAGSRAKTEIWTTHDAGRNWHAASVSPTYHHGWCSNSKLHTYACWRNPLS